MIEAISEKGIVLQCDTQGVIVDVIRDDFGFGDFAAPGNSFFDVFDFYNRSRATDFLATVQAAGAAFDWELSGMVCNLSEKLHFAGSVIDNGVVIVGAPSLSSARYFYEEAIKITNEQAKEQDTKSAILLAQDEILHNELTRLRNELLTTQHELDRKNAELAKLSSQKDEFLGIIAHDLRNPLGIIASYSEFLVENARDLLPSELLGLVQGIQSSSEFMSRLVKDLLTISKIDSGKLRLNFSLVDLLQLVSDNVMLNSILAHKKQIVMLFESEADIPLIIADANRLRQVLDNLITNAIKFSYSETTVRVSLQRDGESVIIRVADEGQGIPVHELDKLFQPFGRTSVQSTAGEESTGLGLAIVRKIVQGHHGRVWVESVVGKGTTFFVSLPIVQSNLSSVHALP